MRVKITVLGVVQGVGFRPFVAGLAEELHIGGSVRNSGGIVTIDAFGSVEAMDRFICRLRGISGKMRDELPAGRVDQLLVEDVEEDCWMPDFRIIDSEQAELETAPLIPADLPICEACIREMKDPGNRRFRYPFISCVNCGPRYSIIEGLPYDRANITMREFELCPDCMQEYRRRGDRRRHAQTISCHNCGPKLQIKDRSGVQKSGEEALSHSIAVLENGGILAVKGIGGYQFVCRPDLEETVLKLRNLKGREKKPFAVMFPDLENIRRYCHVSETEEDLLGNASRPIVLLKPLKGGLFAPSLASESRFVGTFIPYTGLHILLTEACGPLVVTSANLSDDPILTTEEQIECLWKKTPDLLDGIAWNDRRIVTPLDDSLMRVTGGKMQMLRRSRGFVPAPIELKDTQGGKVIAFGGDLKAAFALATGNSVYFSQYFGDLENYRVQQKYTETLSGMQRLLGIQPERLICDMHPGYCSARMAEKMSEELGLPLMKIQHHHAHAASVMAEHGLDHCMAFVFDGTGYGTDGHVWGGEFLLCRGTEYERLGHLSEMVLCGRDASARDAELNAACQLAASGMISSEIGSVSFRQKAVMAEKALKWNVNTENSTSMGRLFDAVSAILGIRNENTYEGECAIALENAAAAAIEKGAAAVKLEFPVVEKGDFLIADRKELLRQLAEYSVLWENRKQNNDFTERAALGFHEAVAGMVLKAGRMIRNRTGENCVALSGGVFVNVILQERCRELLEQDGFSVYVNEQVPGNDGGICLGQVWLAARSFKKPENI